MPATTTQGQVFQLAPASTRARVGLWLLAGVLPVGIAAGLFGYLAAQGSISPATALMAFGATVLPALIIGMAVSKQMRRHRLVLRSDGLRLFTGAHRQRLSFTELDLEHARVLNLDEHLEFKPRLKTNGAFLPGFQAGWYRLRNGSRALVARAAGKRVLWIPTTRDFGLLLQPQQSPRALLQALREAAGSVAAGDGSAASSPPEKTYWFPAKQFGWGWGVPGVWQGWLVLGLYLAGITALMVFAPEDKVSMGVIPMTVLLLIICFLKGEPPRWRWGDDDDF